VCCLADAMLHSALSRRARMSNEKSILAGHREQTSARDPNFPTLGLACGTEYKMVTLPTKVAQQILRNLRNTGLSRVTVARLNDTYVS
jgi:hypothetical protein